MKKKMVVAGVTALILIACGGFYFGGNIGIAEDEINGKQRETVSWREQDYIMTGASDGKSLYVGVMYMKDYSEAKYFLYIKKGGLSFGWHFLQSGSLTEADGIRAFDCGKYGTAYVALNKDKNIKKIEFEDGREPSVLDRRSGPVCERSQSVVRFYDAGGDIIEPNKITIKR